MIWLMLSPNIFIEDPLTKFKRSSISIIALRTPIPDHPIGKWIGCAKIMYKNDTKKKEVPNKHAVIPARRARSYWSL